MPDSEFWPNGTDLRRFVAEHKEELKDKHLIYIIRSNVRADRNIYKTGKTTMGAARLLSYQHAYGWQRKGSPQAGAQLFFYQLVPKREPGVGGTPLVARWEKALEMSMALAGAKKAAGRGKERWRASQTQVKKAVDGLAGVFADMNADYHSDKIRQQPPREASRLGCTCDRVETNKKGLRCPQVKCVPKSRYQPT